MTTRGLEPVFLKRGVNVVLSGHEHFYQRIKPQKGVACFILGNSAKLRRGDVSPTSLNAKAWDTGYGFMLMEVAGDDLFFQVISDQGETVDAGSVRRVAKSDVKQQPVMKAPGAPPAQTTQPVRQGQPAPKQPAPATPAPKK